MKENKREYHGIDLFKFLMALIVVAIHTHPFEQINHETFRTIYDFICSLAVPFFFLVSGYFLFNKGVSKERLSKYLNKSIRLYLLWTLIFLPLTIYEYIVEKTGLINSILSFVFSFVAIGNHYNSWHLWYVWSLILSVFAMKFLFSRNIKPIQVFVMNLIVFILAHIVSILIQHSAYFIALLEKQDNPFASLLAMFFSHSAIFLPTTRLMSGGLYVSLGMLFALNEKKMNMKFSTTAFLFSISMILAVLFVLIFPSEISIIFTVICAVTMFSFAKEIRLKNHSIFSHMRKISVVMYFTHMLFLSLWCIVILKMPTHLGLDVFIFAIIGTLLLFALVIFAEKKSILKWLRDLF